MSHSHRDDQSLAEPVAADTAPASITSPLSAVSNTDAARRAAERRKLERPAQQAIDHQFTGDLPEPSRGGTDTETHLRLTGDDEAAAPDPHDAAASRRGPPAPRAPHIDDESSWLAPPDFGVTGMTGPAAAESWASRAEPASAQNATGAAWVRESSHEA
jgi:hypothetical protein